MKIALIAPYSLYRPDFVISEDARIDGILKEMTRQFKAHAPSDSLLTLAALTPSRHELIYMDDQFESIDIDRPIDLAAITVMTPNADRACDLAAEYKKRGVYVVMGGIHPTLCTDEVLRHADTVITGDADGAWKKFLGDFERGKARRLYRGGAANIEKSPPPMIDLLPRKSFFRNTLNAEVYSILTSVGCSRRCKYCSNWKKPGCSRLRRKGIRQIKGELERIASRSDNFLITIIDDNPFLDVDHISRVLELFRDMRIGWLGPADISISEHPKILKLIRDSGCRILAIGLESLNRDNLKWIAPWKAKFVNSYRERIRIIRDQGLNVMGSFMVGMDFDTKSTFEQDFDFFMETNLAGAVISILTPTPGTPFRKKLIAEERLDTKAPWSAYTAYNLLYEHPTLSKKDIYDGILWFFNRCSAKDVQEHLREVTIS